MSEVSTGLNVVKGAMESLGSSVSAQKVAGFKRVDQIFSADFVKGSGGTKVSGITTHTMNTFIQRGDSVSTGNTGDFVIDGEGMAVVRGSDGEPMYIQVCSFRVDNRGDMVNSQGFKLQGWAVDATGTLPANSAQLESLTTVSTRSIEGRASATTKIDLGMNWKADAPMLQGAGDIIRLATQGANRSTRVDQIIVPDSSAAGSIRSGDQFNLSPDSGLNITTFEYGGIASTRAPSTGSAIYTTGTSTSVAFTFTNPGNAPRAAGVLVEGDQLIIGVGGKNFTLTASNTSSNTAFKSLAGLETALKNIDGITARIENGRLYIASKDANQAITFGDGTAGGNLVSTLGLSDVAAEIDPAVKRFATLSELRQKMNATAGLSSVAASNTISFRAASALQGLDVAASSTGVTRCNFATIGNNTAAGLRSVFIESHDNGLKTGDFVRINGFANAANGATVANGTYMVMSSSADGFTIASQTNANAQATAIAFNNPAGFTYQKIAGQLGTSSAVTVANGHTITTTGGANATVTIANAAPITSGYGGANVAAGDIVYISGFGTQVGITVPDGYYAVGNAGTPNSITITVPNAANGAVGVNASTAQINIQKVGQNAGGAVQAMDTLPIKITAADGTKVRMFIPNNTYVKGDLISLGGFAAPVQSNGLLFTPGKHYTIIDTGTTANGLSYVDFNVDLGAGALADGFLGFNSSYDNAAVPAPIAAVPAQTNFLGPNAYVDSFSKLFDELGLQPSTFSQNGAFTALVPSYDQDDAAKNIAGGKIKDNVKVHAITVYDSLGISHTLNIGFARLQDRQWAVEIYGGTNPDGTQQVQGAIGTPIKRGTIEFDGSGRLLSTGGLDQALPINWTGNADPSSITINWGAIGGLNPDGTPGVPGLTQVAAPFDVRFMNQDGLAPGTLTGIEFTEDGFVLANFDNGTSRKVYQVAVAQFPDMNKLEVLSGMVYRANIDSGAVQLVQPGQGIKIISKAIEGSNVDSTESLLEIQEFSAVYGKMAVVLQTQRKVDDALLARI